MPFVAVVGEPDPSWNAHLTLGMLPKYTGFSCSLHGYPAGTRVRGHAMLSLGHQAVMRTALKWKTVTKRKQDLRSYQSCLSKALHLSASAGEGEHVVYSHAHKKPRLVLYVIEAQLLVPSHDWCIPTSISLCLYSSCAW